MNNMKGSKGFMTIKIDLEKAYDWVDWSFLMETLQQVGLESWMIDIIWYCVSISSMQVLWNGTKTKFLHLSGGHR